MLKTTYSLPEIIHATKSNIVYYEYQPLAKIQTCICTYFIYYY